MVTAHGVRALSQLTSQTPVLSLIMREGVHQRGPNEIPASGHQHRPLCNCNNTHGSLVWLLSWQQPRPAPPRQT
jgi:hypothetical protein